MAKLKKPAAKKKPASKKPSAKPAAKKFSAHGKFAKKKSAKKAAPSKPAKKSAARKAASAKSAPKFVRSAKKANGLPEQMLDAALKVLDARQAEDIFTADVSGRSSVADYVVVASGRASRQIAAIAHYLREAFEKLGSTQVRIEGLQEGNWVLVDSGDVIVHLFRPEVRKYYDLERMWGDRSRA